ncbi:hypothetical protein N7510_002109 [Penicillium lagena]|uniref:uncharacterized protein n=1 Tax=Penicillium lagena TaxID=94218 RepID=UPI0025422915|nr:uncharacterized protein N7510_002109 [Penicillium lagena]KAJ5625800.1 hypothetical protein N7510_002109 [Penicillium lagena]
MVDVRSKPPARAVDRPIARHGKRDAPAEPTNQPRLTESNARRGARTTGNEAAFRDRNAGRNNNREKPTDEAQPPRRGERSGRGRGDRQSRSGQTDTHKKVEQGWGADNGEKAWTDERIGENIAKEDENEPQTPADEEAKELADKSMSYTDYLAEQAQKDSLAAKPVRAANEGTKTDSKWAAAKELKRTEEEDAYIQGSSEKAKREKQRKEKNFLDVDMRFVEQPSSGPRGGGRGGARGGDRGDRAPRGDRGDRAPRGDRGGRGGAPRGDRGAPRGGAAPRGGDRGRGGPRGGAAPRGGARGPAGPTVDEKNFPSLGGK